MNETIPTLATANNMKNEKEGELILNCNSCQKFIIVVLLFNQQSIMETALDDSEMVKELRLKLNQTQKFHI